MVAYLRNDSLAAVLIEPYTRPTSNSIADVWKPLHSPDANENREREKQKSHADIN